MICAFVCFCDYSNGHVEYCCPMERLRQTCYCDEFTSVGVVFDDGASTVACHGSSQADDCFHFDSYLQSAGSSDFLTKLSNTATTFIFIYKSNGTNSWKCASIFYIGLYKYSKDSCSSCNIKLIF